MNNVVSNSQGGASRGRNRTRNFVLCFCLIFFRAFANEGGPRFVAGAGAAFASRSSERVRRRLCSARRRRKAHRLWGRRAVEAVWLRTANRLPLFAVLRLDARLARPAAASLLLDAEAEPAARAGAVADIGVVAVCLRRTGPARSQCGRQRRRPRRRFRRRPFRLLGRAHATGHVIRMCVHQPRNVRIVEVGTPGSKTIFVRQECTARPCTARLNEPTVAVAACIFVRDST